jgi:hypothetical protein
MLDEGDTWPPPNKRSKWEIMLSPKPCAVCGANARYLNTHALFVCPKHWLAGHPAKPTPESARSEAAEDGNPDRPPG